MADHRAVRDILAKRSQLEATFPKCPCGATLSIVTQQEGGTLCRRCEARQHSGCHHMRDKPQPPTVKDIQSYKEEHDCGLYTARDALSNRYQAELAQWILDMIDHLIEETHNK